MRRLTLLAMLASACGGFPDAPPMVVGQECAQGDLRVQLEQGFYEGCAFHLQILACLRAEYEQRFGHVDLTHRVVRMRVADDLREDGAGASGGVTYEDAIDVALGQDVVFPHELNHVRTGPGHAGWCADFEPWSEEVLGFNQRSYLGCN